MKINEKIKKIRELNNLSQDEMVEKLSLATSTYSKIERGLTEITLTRLEQIAKIFNMKTTELLEANGQFV
ncbi:helix-turn-helix transcriptional regulator [Kingella kingae]|uniref:helix-turn-helix domain-containing protein n=1 Tax=Kingella kingae TaxID=504 RepID=UPI0006915316|nr:helix-turn-helix transcriptional regulator [Kingella kingae]MDK4525460.1 helix-turn-helix transcriptional regulator [Kingella kingae]MDK4531485.1 helix-turn-helix transcriptional regulator [Kingella kingae]MDK4536101.1 helix-turn-helix transcriptional regulator [Kingella kingae]MDK4538944.1 helix-turn-helix transcriptional regulator [Kingella kingae]MDK4546097.1 helix-turn-helix transcriptional regulator [Kingella kingae]